MKDIVIIGGGISGLSAAFFLKKKGRDVLLLEKSDHLGGVMWSFEKDGYLLESGPNTFMGLTPALKEMIVPDEKKLTREIAHIKEHYPDVDEGAVRTYVSAQITNEMVFELLDDKKRPMHVEELAHEHDENCTHEH